ncbi:hypothetical protein [Methylobacterium nigriterrae]|uniref:hypothetical protein n=1 Tax=Methylobacterium nigriterrae TaxID=3127512 RepID=UPI003013E6F1
MNAAAIDALLLGPSVEACAAPVVVVHASAEAPIDVRAKNAVALFGEPGRPGGTSAPDGVNEPDWPGAIQLVRDVGARVRRVRDLAQDLSQQSQALIQRSLTRAEAAEERARVAEAAAQSAMRRAAKAEKAARLAEESARAAEEQLQAARAGEAEARLWLKQLYACLRDEFDSLTEG